MACIQRASPVLADKCPPREGKKAMARLLMDAFFTAVALLVRQNADESAVTESVDSSNQFF